MASTALLFAELDVLTGRQGALYPGAHGDENALLETLRTDELERAFAIRGLTTVVIKS